MNCATNPTAVIIRRMDPTPVIAAPARVCLRSMKWFRVIAVVVTLGISGALFWSGRDTRPFVILPDGTKVIFHSLSVGTPETHTSGSGSSYTHHRHPSLVPPPGWWVTSRSWVLGKLPSLVVNALPASWTQVIFYSSSDSFVWHPNPKFRFVFELNNGGVAVDKWNPEIVMTAPFQKNLSHSMWGGVGTGTTTLSLGKSPPAGVPAATPPHPQATWFGVWCDDVPEDAEMLRLDLMPKPTAGILSNNGQPWSLSFKNPLSKPGAKMQK